MPFIEFHYLFVQTQRDLSMPDSFEKVDEIRLSYFCFQLLSDLPQDGTNPTVVEGFLVLYCSY